MDITRKLLKRLLLITLLISLTAFYDTLIAQGYKIKIKIAPLKDSSIILGHYFGSPNSLYPDDTIKLDKNGAGIFKAKKALPVGMYFLYLPSKKIFDILLSDNQTFSIAGDTSGLLKNVKFDGSPENSLFYEYRNFIEDKSIEVNQLLKKKKNTINQQEKDSLTKVSEKINQEVLGYIKKLKTDHPKLFLATVLKSLEEIEVPAPPKDDKGKILDSSFQYNYWHNHFFDNFDYTDARLLRTPFYEKPITKYIEKVIPQMPDSINHELDLILEKVHSNRELFRYLLGTFFKHYASSQIVGMDAVFVHISEKWFIPYATWADKESVEKIKKEIARMKPNLIGNIAPNIKLVEVPSEHFLVAKFDTAAKSNPYVGNNIILSDIKAKFLILVFWESDCGHCQKIIPFLYDSVYPRLKDRGVKILAVHMISSIEGKRKWIDFVNEHQMYDWINAWSPYSYDFMDLYNVSYKPLFYLLDENKKIICKRISAEQIEQIINLEEK